MIRNKTILTTGQVARICQVAPRTVSKWFDSGRLKGYRIPGSKDRRIPVDELTRFMRAHDIPFDALHGAQTRVLIVDGDHERGESLSAALKRHNFETELVESTFSAGVAVVRFEPNVVLVDDATPDLRNGEPSFASRVGDEVRGVRIIGMVSDAGTAEELRREGYDECLVRPFNVQEVLRAVGAIVGFAPVL